MALKRQCWTKAVTIHIEMSRGSPSTLFQQDAEKNSRKNVGYTYVKIFTADYELEKYITLERNSNAMIMRCLEDSPLTHEV